MEGTVTMPSVIKMTVLEVIISAVFSACLSDHPSSPDVV